MDAWDELSLRAAKELRRAGFARLCIEDDGLDRSEVAALSAVIEAANSEAPIQKYLAEHPHQLRGEFDGNCRWAKAHPRLAGRYEPDFLVARTDSTGMRWSLIELQSPAPGPLYTKKGRKSAQLDEGIEQIRAWREWLRENSAMARRPVVNAG